MWYRCPVTESTVNQSKLSEEDIPESMRIDHLICDRHMSVPIFPSFETVISASNDENNDIYEKIYVFKILFLD